MDGIKVGDRLWQFDINRRKYSGTGLGARIIYAEHFIAHIITGETPRSWIIETFGHVIKVSKSGLKEAGRRGFGHQWFTDQGREDEIWSNVHRPKIRRMIDGADAATLRKVAEIVGLSDECD